MKQVRYCPECGHLGEVRKSAFDCCPTSRPFLVPEAIAEQARVGFLAKLAAGENPFMAVGHLVEHVAGS